MPSQKNIEKVNQLKESIDKSKSVILADYAGLSVKQQNELRQKIKDAGGQFTVAKNRLFKLALNEKNIKQGDFEKALKGTNAFIFAYRDEISPIKALIEFSQSNDLPKTKIGLMLDTKDKILTIEEIEALAKLPTRDQLVAQFICTLNAPRVRFVNALSANLVKLTSVLSEIKNHKESN